MKTQQYYKDITFTFIKIFDIKLATLKHGTGKFCSWQMICKFCRHIKCPYKCRLCIMKPLIKYIKKVLQSVIFNAGTDDETNSGGETSRLYNDTTFSQLSRSTLQNSTKQIISTPLSNHRLATVLNMINFEVSGMGEK